MGMLILNIIPSAEMLLELSPEELAGPLMECLNSLVAAEESQLNRYNYVNTHAISYPQDHREPKAKR